MAVEMRKFILAGGTTAKGADKTKGAAERVAMLKMYDVIPGHDDFKDVDIGDVFICPDKPTPSIPEDGKKILEERYESIGAPPAKRAPLQPNSHIDRDEDPFGFDGASDDYADIFGAGLDTEPLYGPPPPLYH